MYYKLKKIDADRVIRVLSNRKRIGIRTSKIKKRISRKIEIDRRGNKQSMKIIAYIETDFPTKIRYPKTKWADRRTLWTYCYGAGIRNPQCVKGLKIFLYLAVMGVLRGKA